MKTKETTVGDTNEAIRAQVDAEMPRPVGGFENYAAEDAWRFDRDARFMQLVRNGELAADRAESDLHETPGSSVAPLFSKPDQSEHRGQIDSILELAGALKVARAGVSQDVSEEAAEQAIREDALEVCFRSGWVTSSADMEPAEYFVLIATGGPAYRLTGELDSGQADSVRLEYQNWGTPWVTVPLTAEELAACCVYVNCFYFGE